MFIFLHCEIHFDLLVYCLYNSLMFNNAFYIIHFAYKIYEIFNGYICDYQL